MKRKLTLILATAILSAGSAGLAYGQNPAVLSQLKAKYSLTRHQPECGGWYLIGETRGGVNYYGFADKEGNIIASNATEYKIHKGFVELRIFDEQKKAEHDRWLDEKRQYDRDLQAYDNEQKQYNEALAAHNEKVESAKAQAEKLWKADQKAASDEAKKKYREEHADDKKSKTVAGKLVKGLGNMLSENSAGEEAAKKIEYQPYEDKVFAERRIPEPPKKPTTPKPSIGAEPSDGYEWRNFPLLQPCPYTEIDYAAIADDKGVAIVKGSGGYGLADASLKSLLPCTYTSIQKAGKNFSLCTEGKFGLADARGKITVPCEFDKIDFAKGYLLGRKGMAWGVYTDTFEELYPCQYSELKIEDLGGRHMMHARHKGLWGVHDISNSLQVLPHNFNKIESLAFAKEDYFVVTKGESQGLYTASGTLMLPCEYSGIFPKRMGDGFYFEVSKDGFVGVFDLDADPIFSPDAYDSYTYAEGAGFIVGKDGRKGFVNMAGMLSLPLEFSDLVYAPEQKCLIAAKDGKVGLLDMLGKEAFPFVDGSKMEPALYDEKKGRLNFLIVTQPDGRYAAYDYTGRPLDRDAKKTKNLNGKVGDAAKAAPGDHAYLAAADNFKTSASASEALANESLRERHSFSHFARNYVERVINDWQTKGEYEKTDDWMKRVNEETRQQKVFALTKEAQEHYIAARQRELPVDRISISGPYDPDNETFCLTSDYSQRPLTVNVPMADAEEFKSALHRVQAQPVFTVDNDYIGLSEYHFTTPDGKAYHYRNDEALSYAVANVEYNFNKIDLGSAGKQGFSTSSLKIGTSDVDVRIPATDLKQDKTFAIIIANEKYENEKNVDFAYNDGVIFKEYCIKAMGLPETNVHFVPNASLNQMRQQFNWIQKTADDFEGEAQFIIYYAGHGMPDDNTKEAYLLPADADATDIESSYKLSKLYETFGSLPAKNVVMIMDACFSGSQRNGETLASARGVALKPKPNAPKGNMTVFSAVTDKETAFAYHDKQHGLFTYFLLKKMQEHPGALTFGELADYVSKQVAQHSIVVNKKSQHPTVTSAPAIGDGWRSIRLK